jgi:glycosyltransferase involved in cell wall biosynthesis
VQPRLGVFTEVVEKTGGGILTTPGDVDSLADGILALWENAERRRQLGATGYEGVRARYGVPQMLARVMEVYEPLVAQ